MWADFLKRFHPTWPCASGFRSKCLAYWMVITQSCNRRIFCHLTRISCKSGFMRLTAVPSLPRVPHRSQPRRAVPREAPDTLSRTNSSTCRKAYLVLHEEQHVVKHQIRFPAQIRPRAGPALIEHQVADLDA